MKKVLVFLVALVVSAGFFGCYAAGAGGIGYPAVSIPPEYSGVVIDAWLIRPALRSREITGDIGGDPIIDLCAEPSSIYEFRDDKSVVQWVCKPEEYGTLLRAFRLKKEVWEIQFPDEEWNYRANPPILEIYTPLNPAPLPPLLHVYVVDKDNTVITDYDMAAISPDDPEAYYAWALSGPVQTQVEIKDMENPSGAPHRWLGGGTKIIIPPGIEEPVEP